MHIEQVLWTRHRPTTIIRATLGPLMLLRLCLTIRTKLPTSTLACTIPIWHIPIPRHLLHLTQHNHLIALLSRTVILSFRSARVRRSTFPNARLQYEDEHANGDGDSDVDEDYRAGLAREMEAQAAGQDEQEKRGRNEWCVDSLLEAGEVGLQRWEGAG